MSYIYTYFVFEQVSDLLAHNGKHLEGVARITGSKNQPANMWVLTDKSLRVDSVGAPAHGTVDQLPSRQVRKTSVDKFVDCYLAFVGK